MIRPIPNCRPRDCSPVYLTGSVNTTALRRTYRTKSFIHHIPQRGPIRQALTPYRHSCESTSVMLNPLSRGAVVGRWHRLWFKHLLLRLLESVGGSGQRDKVQPVAMMGAAPDEARSPLDPSAIRRTSPPLDWSDMEGWNRCLKAEAARGPFGVPTAIGARGWQSVQFLKFARHLGGRVWFPGCGTDPGPRFYAYVGCLSHRSARPVSDTAWHPRGVRQLAT